MHMHVLFSSNLLLCLHILCAHLPDSTITISLKTKCSTLGKISISAHQILTEASLINGFFPLWGNLIDNGGFNGLKNATFPQRSNCGVTLYQDAHHHSTFHPPGNLCGTPRNLWEDVYKAIDDAKYLVYIAGWSFNPKLILVRDSQTEIPHARGVRLGELPLSVRRDGLVEDLVEHNGYFPDTKAPIRGRRSKFLPPTCTT